MAGNSKRDSLSIMGFVVGSIALVLGAAFSGIIVEWIGMWFWWPEKGALHSMEMVVAEANYLNDDFIHAMLFGYTPMDLVNFVADLVTGAPFSGQTIDPANWHSFTGMFNGNEMLSWAQQYLLAAIYVTIVCLIRMVIIIFTLPLYLLFYILAFCDGLMIRDLRRYGGGRESGIKYHYSKRLVLPSLWGGWALYLAIPFTVHPNLILVPSVICGALCLWIATKSFKKYL